MGDVKFWVRVDVEIGTGGRFNYVVIASTGFRAIMERCDRDACADGYMSACARPVNSEHMHSSGPGSGSVDLWLKHSAKFCHGWHDERVAAFAASVRRSHGSWRPFTLAEAVRKSATPRWPIEKLADALEMDVTELRAELAKAAA